MIVVDTSVWIAFLRDPGWRHSATLGQCLDDDAVLLPVSVRVELLSGVGAQSVAVLRRTLGALPLLTPGADTWALVEEWALRGAAAGQRFGVGDLLVGACASERGAAVWSLDADFERMARLRLIKRFKS